jgi:hypothetical protein
MPQSVKKNDGERVDRQVAHQGRQQARKQKRLAAAHKEGKHQEPLVTCDLCVPAGTEFPAKNRRRREPVSFTI